MTAEATVIGTISAEAFVMVSKRLVREFKGDGTMACFLSELVSAYQYHKQGNSLEVDGAFPIPTNRYKATLCMSQSKQSRVLSELETQNMLSIRMQGFPKTKYCLLNWDAIAAIVTNDDKKEERDMKDQFYQTINQTIGMTEITRSNVEYINPIFGNMNEMLRGALILISTHYIKQYRRPVQWSSSTVGRIRQWTRNKSAGKPFDYSIVTESLALTKFETFDKYIGHVIKNSNKVLPKHFTQQSFDYKQLLKG